MPALGSFGQATQSTEVSDTRQKLLAATLLTSVVAFFGLYLDVWLFFGQRGANESVLVFGPHAFVGFCAIWIGVWLLPQPLIYRIRASAVLGGIFGFLFFVFGTVFGSLSSSISLSPWDPMSYFLQPLVILGLYGAIPSFLVGVVGTALLRVTLPPPNQIESTK